MAIGIEAAQHKAKVPRSVWAAVEYGTLPLLLLVATPVLLNHLGLQLYGLWIFVISCAGLGSLFTLGAASTATRHVSYWQATGERRLVLETARCCIALATITVMLPSLMIWGASEYLAIAWFGKLGPTSQVRSALLVVAIVMFVNEIDAVVAGVLRGFDQWRGNAITEIIGRGILVAGACQIAIEERGLLTLLLWTVVSYVCKFIMRAAILAYMLPDLLDTLRVSRDVLNQTVRFGRWQGIQSLAAFLLLTFDRILVGAWLGAAALARYTVCIQLAQQIHAIPAAAGSTLYPFASRLSAAKKTIEMRQLAVMALPLLMFASVLAGCLIVFRHEILSVWIGDAFAKDNGHLFAYLAVAFFVLAISVVPHYLLLGFGEPHVVAITNLLGGLAYVGAALILLGSEDLVALAQARVIYGLILFLGFTRLAKYIA
jgi:O-antigen/teichoic acid export membrane protein